MDIIKCYSLQKKAQNTIVSKKSFEESTQRLELVGGWAMQVEQNEHNDHNQCTWGLYLPNCVQVVLCADVVINI